MGNTMTNGLAALLSAISSDDDDDAPRSAPLPEAQIATLREFQVRFAELKQRVPFKPGDIVTIAPTAPVKGAGRPHIVLEVVQPDDAHRTWGEDSGSNHFGKKCEVRIAVIGSAAGSHVIGRHWVEAIDLIPYEPA